MCGTLEDSWESISGRRDEVNFGGSSNWMNELLSVTEETRFHCITLLGEGGFHALCEDFCQCKPLWEATSFIWCVLDFSPDIAHLSCSRLREVLFGLEVLNLLSSFGQVLKWCCQILNAQIMKLCLLILNKILENCKVCQWHELWISAWGEELAHMFYSLYKF